MVTQSKTKSRIKICSAITLTSILINMYVEDFPISPDNNHQLDPLFSMILRKTARVAFCGKSLRNENTIYTMKELSNCFIPNINTSL